MLRKRLIPLLLLSDEGLVKGKKFSNYRYLGDPINTIKIFNEKGADELIFIDINATNENRLIDIKFVEEVADECYMPFTVGGGISSINDIKQILKAGAEKVSINTKSIIDKEFITEASDYFGSQSIVVSLDINKDWLGSCKARKDERFRLTKVIIGFGPSGTQIPVFSLECEVHFFTSFHVFPLQLSVLEQMISTHSYKI